MEQKLISFEETQKQVDAQNAETPVDLCGLYKKARPILNFIKQFLPKLWKEIVDAFMKLIDEQCHIQP